MHIYDVLSFSKTFPDQIPFAKHNKDEYTIYTNVLKIPFREYKNLKILWCLRSTLLQENYHHIMQDVEIQDKLKFIFENNPGAKFFFADQEGMERSVFDKIDELKTIITHFCIPYQQVVIVPANLYDKFLYQELILQNHLQGITFQDGDSEPVAACVDYGSYKAAYKKKFIFLCRRYDLWRTFIFLDLHRRSILTETNAIFTWSRVNPYTGEIIKTKKIIADMQKIFTHCKSDKFKKEFFNWFNNHGEKIIQPMYYVLQEEVKEKKDIIQKTSRLWSTNVVEYPAVIQQTQKTLGDCLNRSHISLIIETNYYTDKPALFHLTEKTLRSIWFKLPFIIYAEPRFLAKLKNCGFKTFNDYWDESYDEVLDPFDRACKINGIVEDLNNIPTIELDNILAECSLIAAHNFIVLNKWKYDYKKNADLYMKEKKLIFNKATEIK